MTVGDPSVTVVEEVIRDGCYVRDFKLAPDQLADLVSRVDELSFVDLIDVGPGTGFGTETPEPRPPVTEYLPIVADAVSETGLTTLLLPGVAGEKEVELLAAYEELFDLVRVGVDVDNVEAARPLLRAFEDRDVRTSLNLLKTYLVSPSDAARAASFGVEHGVDLVYVVDSAGGLTPADVRSYTTAVATAGVDVGYHGHDNVGFGVSNALAAIRSGAAYVDTSLQGIGRSAGNTQTELVCGQFRDDIPPADWRKLRELEGRLASVYPGEEGVSVEDVLYGLAGLHSSRADKLRAFATDRGESYLDLLVFAARNGLATLPQIRSAYEEQHSPIPVR